MQLSDRRQDHKHALRVPKGHRQLTFALELLCSKNRKAILPCIHKRPNLQCIREHLSKSARPLQVEECASAAKYRTEQAVFWHLRFPIDVLTIETIS